jgi:type I restriction enzyme R subunit
MSPVGQKEKKTQARVVKLFREILDYEYLGDRTDREDNANVEAISSFLVEKTGGRGALIPRALHLLKTTVGDTSKSLYDRNRRLRPPALRGEGEADVGEINRTVWLIDWENP